MLYCFTVDRLIWLSAASLDNVQHPAAPPHQQLRIQAVLSWQLLCEGKQFKGLRLSLATNERFQKMQQDCCKIFSSSMRFDGVSWVLRQVGAGSQNPLQLRKSQGDNWLRGWFGRVVTS